MQPLWTFSTTDNSIDIVVAFIFAAALFHSVKYLIINNINIQGKIFYSIIAVISLLQIVQVGSQLLYGGPVGVVTFRIWDLINYITAAFMLMATQRIHKRERYGE